jgi:hypothetical protein
MTFPLMTTEVVTGLRPEEYLPAVALPAAWDWRSVRIAAGPTVPFAGLPPPVRLDEGGAGISFCHS